MEGNMELKSSRTKENLMRAFAGESMARNRYTFAAATAKREGYPVLEALFSFTAGQEKEHAEIFYEYLRGCGCTNVEISAGYPVGEKADTQSLLEYAVHNEEEEHGLIYPDFAKMAHQEGLEEIAGKFGLIARIEKLHAERFDRFLNDLKNDQMYISEQDTGWTCLNCGFMVTSTVAPKECPVCGHPRGWFCRVELAPFQNCRNGL